METALSIVGIGLLFGLKHALDADHLAAVATVASERRSAFGSATVGMWWGLGHAAALLFAGTLLVVFRIRIGDDIAAILELGVAAMLIYLGSEALWKIARSEQIHLHVHRHGGRVHIHPHLHDHSHAAEPTAAESAHHGIPGRRPFLVGLVHGLAGSAALMLLVASTIPTPGLAMAYIGAFGIGSIGGMAAMSTLVGLPATLTERRYVGADRIVRVVAAVCSVGIGLSLAYRIVL
jgi:ABC-type nickel/cobalt efflux system permease component RcnA